MVTTIVYQRVVAKIKLFYTFVCIHQILCNLWLTYMFNINMIIRRVCTLKLMALDYEFLQKRVSFMPISEGGSTIAVAS